MPAKTRAIFLVRCAICLVISGRLPVEFPWRASVGREPYRGLIESDGIEDITLLLNGTLMVSWRNFPEIRHFGRLRVLRSWQKPAEPLCT